RRLGDPPTRRHVQDRFNEHPAAEFVMTRRGWQRLLRTGQCPPTPGRLDLEGTRELAYVVERDPGAEPATCGFWVDAERVGDILQPGRSRHEQPIGHGRNIEAIIGGWVAWRSVPARPRLAPEGEIGLDPRGAHSHRLILMI